MADTATVVEKFEEEVGQNDRAARGMAHTIDALRMAKVDVLLVVDDPEDQRELWFGAGPTQLGTTREEVEALGEESPTQARAVDVLIRGALGTGAAVRVLPVGSRVTDGVGAILRWSS